MENLLQNIGPIFVLALPVVFAVLCYKMAQNRNRDPQVGALAGLFLGFFAVFYYAIVGQANHSEEGGKENKAEEGMVSKIGQKALIFLVGVMVFIVILIIIGGWA